MLIEPHKHILKIPHGNKDLYKIIPGSYFIEMIKHKYLYFRRVDTYSDDFNDSALPYKDRILSQQSRFQNAPDVSMSDYYDKCRSKSYACCFTTQISNYIWKHYCNNDPNAICIVFKSSLLIKHLNSTLNQSRLIINEQVHHDFFWINYGLVDYIDYDEQYIQELLPNPTKYLYIKDRRFIKEKEFRISLSCLQYEHYILPNGEELQFPESMKLEFDFTKNIVKRLEIRSNHNNSFIREIKQALGGNIHIKIL